MKPININDAGRGNSYDNSDITVECRVAHNGLLPKRAHDTDAGADLYSAETLVLKPGEMKLVDTGVGVKVPVGYGGFVLNRSSQRVAKITSLGTGLIDSDYRGNIKVVLVNEGTADYAITAGETRIGQLVIIPVLLPKFVDSWNDTERGTGGFGSTNK